MPDHIPRLNHATMYALRGKPYSETVYEVLNVFLQNEIPEKTLRAIVEESYTFAVPVEHIADRFLLRLDQGPTASFKDFAAQCMARLTEYFLKEEKKTLTILTATSGDTGGAVAAAFHNREHIRVVVLFPQKEISERQRKQMTTLGGNVTAVAVQGKFDDCQRMVKQAFADTGLANSNLSSANSINVGRLLPQIVYYWYGWAHVAKNPDKEIIFSVPSGNLGNLMAGLLAKRMGLPVRKFIAATNENDEFPKFLASGRYSPVVPSRACLSNAMNVGHPSNLARIVDFYGGAIDEKGIISKEPDMDAMRRDIASFSVSDEETKAAIKNAYRDFGILLEPHGAVGWTGLEKFLGNSTPQVPAAVLETAHPAKFPEPVKETTGVDPMLPEGMQGLETKKEELETIAADFGELKNLLQNIQ